MPQSNIDVPQAEPSMQRQEIKEQQRTQGKPQGPGTWTANRPVQSQYQMPNPDLSSQANPSMVPPVQTAYQPGFNPLARFAPQVAPKPEVPQVPIQTRQDLQNQPPPPSLIPQRRF